jgi:hypothetical protein
MKSVTFPQANCKLAEHQDEYETLHVHAEARIVKNEDGEDVQIINSMIACFELSDEEIEQIVKNRRLYYRQMLFGHKFHPMLITTETPFIEQSIDQNGTEGGSKKENS